MHKTWSGLEAGTHLHAQGEPAGRFLAESLVAVAPVMGPVNEWQWHEATVTYSVNCGNTHQEAAAADVHKRFGKCAAHESPGILGASNFSSIIRQQAEPAASS